MTTDPLLRTALIIVLVGWICYRQVTWRPIVASRMWRMAFILALVGVIELVSTDALKTVTTFDITMLIIETVASLGIGAVMGLIAVIRPLSTEGRASVLSGGRAGETPLYETRTGWWGLGLWVVFIALRIGMDVWAGANGAQLASTIGAILIVVAANRAARTAVLLSRLERMRTVAPLQAAGR
jgi:hypothetical protein